MIFKSHRQCPLPCVTSATCVMHVCLWAPGCIHQRDQQLAIPPSSRLWLHTRVPRAAFGSLPEAEGRCCSFRIGRTSANINQKIGCKKSLLKLAKQEVWSEGSMVRKHPKQERRVARKRVVHNRAEELFSKLEILPEG